MRKVPRRNEVQKLLTLFRAKPGNLILEDNELEADLKAVLRVVLQSHRELQRLGDDPAAALEADASLHGDIDMLRDDIRSVLESFEKIESVAASLGQVPRVSWPWPDGVSWSKLRTSLRVGLLRLGKPNIAMVDRYAQLVGLIRVDLCFWGLTAGMTAEGYIRA